jgi:hypothetical protein
MYAGDITKWKVFYSYLVYHAALLYTAFSDTKLKFCCTSLVANLKWDWQMFSVCLCNSYHNGGEKQCKFLRILIIQRTLGPPVQCPRNSLYCSKVSCLPRANWRPWKALYSFCFHENISWQEGFSSILVWPQTFCWHFETTVIKIAWVWVNIPRKTLDHWP